MKIARVGVLAVAVLMTAACGGTEQEDPRSAPSPSEQHGTTDPQPRLTGAKVELRQLVAFEKDWESFYGSGVSGEVLNAFDGFACGDRPPKDADIGITFLCDADGQAYILGAPEMTTRIASAKVSPSGQGDWSVVVSIDPEDADDLALTIRLMDAETPMALIAGGEVTAAFDPNGEVENGAFTFLGLTKAKANLIARSLS